jgi:hypothetical protein
MGEVEIGGLLVAAAALVVSVLSFYFSIKSWRESNRPIVITRISTSDSGEGIAFLDLLVENTGSRPAKNIKLSVNNQNLHAALVSSPDQPTRKYIERCFAEDTVIPILANGKAASSAFGILSYDERSDWRRFATFDVFIKYHDLDGREYNHSIPLLITSDQGFAGGVWKSGERK